MLVFIFNVDDSSLVSNFEYPLTKIQALVVISVLMLYANTITYFIFVTTVIQ